MVIDPAPQSLRTFIEALDPARYAWNDPFGALARRDMFNVVDIGQGWKLDLVIIKDRPFSRSEFDRRLPMELAGIRAFVATAEDTILAKLEWSRLGRSERQLRDVVGMLAVSKDSLDRSYLAHWAEELGLTRPLADAQRLADEELAGETDAR